ncbi:MAG: rRNA large subunit methyltransferase I, partial [Candidatus Izemoplasmatales bacterium]
LQVQVTKANVFHYLRDKLSQDVKYELIILDPPAFTKTKQKLQDAYRGYKEINLQAMHLIEHGGILISASCSQHMTPSLFFEMLQDAADDAGKIIQMMDFRIQSPDHPTLLSSEETLYLKLVVARVFDSRKEGSL